MRASAALAGERDDQRGGYRREREKSNGRYPPAPRGSLAILADGLARTEVHPLLCGIGAESCTK
jgi:hypothetical protein